MTVGSFTLPQLSDAKLPVRDVAWRVNGCNCCKDYATPSQTHMVVHVYEERKKDPDHFQGWMPTGLLRQFDPTHPAAPTDVDHQWYNGPQTDLPQNSRATYMCFAGSKLNLVGISTEGNGRVAVKAAQCDLVHGVGKQLPPFLAPPHPDNVQATLWMLPAYDTTTRLDLHRIKALDSACRHEPAVIKFLLPPKLRTPSGRSFTITVWDSAKFVLLGRRKREEYKEIREPLNRYFANFLVPMGCMTRAEFVLDLRIRDFLYPNQDPDQDMSEEEKRHVLMSEEELELMEQIRWAIRTKAETGMPWELLEAVARFIAPPVFGVDFSDPDIQAVLEKQ
jgi:hypothetical protein